MTRLVFCGGGRDARTPGVPLRIWDWRRSYFEPPPALRCVLEGRGWHFSCRFGGQRMKNFGGSFYPEVCWRPADITALSMALDTLRFAPPPDAKTRKLYRRPP